MGPWLLLLVAAIYIGVAASYWIDGRYGMMFAFIAYALANLGFIFDWTR